MLQKLDGYEPSATISQLKDAARLIEEYRSNLELPTEQSRVVRDLDAFLLRAVVEAALTQGDLRLELERLLGRTLWWASAADDHREALLDAAQERAEALRSPTVPQGWNRVIYRTGLDRATCETLRERLSRFDPFDICSLADSVKMSPEQSEPILEQLALVAASVSPIERPWPIDLGNGEENAEIVRLWLRGGDSCLPGRGSLEKAFEYLGRYAPWVVGASVEILAWMHALDPPQLARIHVNLDLDRLRHGVPSSDAAKLVELGLPRAEAADLWHRYQASRVSVSFLAFVVEELETETCALLGLEQSPDDALEFDWSNPEDRLSTGIWDPGTVLPF